MSEGQNSQKSLWKPNNAYNPSISISNIFSNATNSYMLLIQEPMTTLIKTPLHKLLPIIHFCLCARLKNKQKNEYISTYPQCTTEKH